MELDFERIKKYDAFKDLKEESYETLKNHARYLNAPVNHNILFEKHSSEYVYFVLSGVVSVYKINEDGKRKVIFMFGEGSFLNEDYQKEYNSVISAQAFENSLLLCIPKDIFYDLIESDVTFMKHIYKSLSNKVRRIYRQMNNVEVRLDKKVASKLYKLAKDYGIQTAKGTLIDINLSVTYLSDLLGARRESVSRALKILVDENLITYDKKNFVVRDVKELAAYFKKSKR